MSAHEVEEALQTDAEQLAGLIYASGSDNLNSVFSGHQASLTLAQRKAICLNYLRHALRSAEGQFGYQNQHIIRKDQVIAGCVSFWVKPLSAMFRKATFDSLLTHFNGLDSALILQNSMQLAHLVKTPDDQSLSIGHLAVQKDYQRQGLSTSLLGFCEHQARLLGKVHLILDLNASNTIALKGYQNFGFQVLGTTEPTPQGKKLGLSSHIHMRKSLSS